MGTCVSVSVSVSVILMNEQASERCAFPLKLITITYQSLIFVRCLLKRTQWTGALCVRAVCMYHNVVDVPYLEIVWKTMKCIVLLNRSSSFWQRKDIFMRLMVGLGFAEEAERALAQLHDKMIRTRQQQQPQPQLPHQHSLHFSLVPIASQKKNIKISPLDLIQWIKLNIYWNSFSQRIHQNHLHTYNVRRTSCSHKIQFTVHSVARLIAGFFSFFHSVHLPLALSFSLCFIIILPSCRCS